MCLLYFCLAGTLVLPYLGVENDEALFANGVFDPELMPGHFELFGQQMASMVMLYVGALKSWVYSLIFGLVSPTRWTLRIPMILAGAASIWFSYRFLYRVSGRTAAIIGCVLLATDVSYILTITFDRGPVAPQQFLVAGGLLLALQGYQERSDLCLAGAFLLFGLALWDKVVFVWMFSGIVIASVIVFPREVWRFLTFRRCALAAAAFLLGSLPFLTFNLLAGMATFRGNQTTGTWPEVVNKAVIMHRTLSGTALSNYLVDFDSPVTEPVEVAGLEGMAVALSDWVGHPTQSLLPYLLCLSLLFAPLAWVGGGRARRALLFFPIACAVTWAQMLLTARAGGSSHHTVLIWFHIAGFTAVSLALATKPLRKLGPPIMGAAVLAVALSNVVLLNDYYAGMVRHGPARFWSDALYPLTDYLRDENPGYVYCIDWGFDNSLRLFIGGSIPVRIGVDGFPRAELNDTFRTNMRIRFSQPTAVFVSYVDGRDVFPEMKAVLRQFADEEGYQKVTLREFRDSRNRPVFEVFRYIKGTSTTETTSLEKRGGAGS